ncbi:hypothetical protein IEQ34_010464 [Dendrobium chrysotoxum]|uniref:Uncharacterized protein n=1 Tax=Dendrobium chrysotoxum TaxID=161865 RepID=A0AAV7GUW7_DENCH|nr:hypothetical protein IEQ34_010464 [Dendrobium chrysotoxum]
MKFKSRPYYSHNCKIFGHNISSHCITHPDRVVFFSFRRRHNGTLGSRAHQFFNGDFRHAEEPLNCLTCLVEAQQILKVKKLACNVKRKSHPPVSRSLCRVYLAMSILSHWTPPAGKQRTSAAGGCFLWSCRCRSPNGGGGVGGCGDKDVMEAVVMKGWRREREEGGGNIRLFHWVIKLIRLRKHLRW